MTPSPLQGSSSASAPRRTSARAGSGCADRSREEAPPWTTSARYQQSHTFARRGADCEGDVSGEVIDAGPRWETIAGTFRPSDHVTAQPSNLRGAFRTRGVLPSIILEKQHALGLDAIDVNILLQLARHWWYRDNPPHPSKASIAECLGVDPSTVRRHIAAMEAAGLIQREARYKKSGGQENNAYHFDGLIKEATPFAEEAIRERERQKSERVARQHRKRPRLVVNNQPTDSGRRS